MSRISRDNMFLSMAQVIARRGTCPRAMVGAIAVIDGRPVCSGYNGALPHFPHCTDEGVGCVVGPDGGCMRATHAEANIVARCARVGIALGSCELFCTHACCEKCAALLVACGLRRLVYLKPYRLSAGLELLNNANIEVCHAGS